MKLQSVFTPEALEEISKAVQEAEAGTAGEIVPVIAAESSSYDVVKYRAGIFSALFCGMILAVVYQFTSLLLFFPPWLWLIACFTAGMMGATLTTFILPLKRLLIGNTMMKEHVLKKAQEMFLLHGVNETTDHAGILLFISFFERKAVILTDFGINQLVEPGTWDELMKQFTGKLKKKQYLNAIISTVAECGVILEASGMEKTGPDDNEIKDHVRLED